MENIKNVEKFYYDSQRFFEFGLLREIYSSDDFSICNVANQGYAVFNYHSSRDGQVGLLATPEMISKIVDSPQFLYELINTMDDRTLSKLTIALNDRSFAVLQGFKNKTDINGPSATIDFTFEEEMMKLSNDKGRSK